MDKNNKNEASISLPPLVDFRGSIANQKVFQKAFDDVSTVRVPAGTFVVGDGFIGPPDKRHRKGCVMRYGAIPEGKTVDPKDCSCNRCTT